MFRVNSNLICQASRTEYSSGKPIKVCFEQNNMAWEPMMSQAVVAMRKVQLSNI